ncbi:MAG: bestrophin [Acetobacteraceae bacterium]|nr:bestrophin [Acetobacteraceae bacterium]
MIVRPKPSIGELFFIMRGSIVPQIAVRVLAIGLISLLVSAFAHVSPASFPEFTLAPFTILGLALSIFLGFRNNACYERWWEARKQLGQLLAELRSLAREVQALFPGQEQAEYRGRVLKRAIAYAHSLVAELRGEEQILHIGPWLPPGEAATLASKRNVAQAVLTTIATELGERRREGALSEVLFGMFEMRLASLASIQAACERLQATPIPFAYTLLVHRTAYIYCGCLPFGLAGALGWATPFAAALVAYTFFGLDALSDELEQPFGKCQNAMPLSALARDIEIDLMEAGEEVDLPQPLRPVRYVLQ